MSKEEKILKKLVEHDKKSGASLIIKDINESSIEEVKECAIASIDLSNKCLENMLKKIPLPELRKYTAAYTAMRMSTLILALKEEGYQIYNKVGAIKHE